MKMINDLKKGDTVYMVAKRNSNAARGLTLECPEEWVTECVVKTVGRKYITVTKATQDFGLEYSFFRSGSNAGQHNNGQYSGEYILYTDHDEAVNVIKKEDILRKLKTATVFDTLSLEQFQVIAAMCKLKPSIGEFCVAKAERPEPYKVQQYNDGTRIISRRGALRCKS